MASKSSSVFAIDDLDDIDISLIEEEISSLYDEIKGACSSDDDDDDEETSNSPENPDNVSNETSLHTESETLPPTTSSSADAQASCSRKEGTGPGVSHKKQGFVAPTEKVLVENTSLLERTEDEKDTFSEDSIAFSNRKEKFSYKDTINNEGEKLDDVSQVISKEKKICDKERKKDKKLFDLDPSTSLVDKTNSSFDKKINISPQEKQFGSKDVGLRKTSDGDKVSKDDKDCQITKKKHKEYSVVTLKKSLRKKESSKVSSHRTEKESSIHKPIRSDEEVRALIPIDSLSKLQESSSSSSGAAPSTPSSSKVIDSVEHSVEEKLSDEGEERTIHTSGSNSPRITVKSPAKKQADNEYEAEYYLSEEHLAVVDYIITQGIGKKFIKGISGATMLLRGSLATDGEIEADEKPLHLYLRGPNKDSVQFGVQLVNFLKKKAEENEGLLECDRRRNKVKIRKISKKSGESKLEVEDKAQRKLDKVELKNEQQTEIEDNREETKENEIKEQYNKDDIKKEKRKGDNIIKENKDITDGKLKEKELGNKKKVQENLDQDNKKYKNKHSKKLLDEIKSRQHHKQKENFHTKIEGTQKNKYLRRRKSFEKSRLFQDKEDRRKHEEALKLLKSTPGAMYSATKIESEYILEGLPDFMRNHVLEEVFIKNEKIKTATGASISIKGNIVSNVGNSPALTEERPPYFLIQATSHNAVYAGIQMIDKIIKEAKDKDKVKVTKMAVGMDTAPSQFNLVSRVEGVGGSHLQFIADQSGASVTLKGRGSGFLEPVTGLESHEPLHVMVQHKNLECLSKAKQLVLSLVKVVQKDCVEFVSKVRQHQPSVAALEPGIEKDVALRGLDLDASSGGSLSSTITPPLSAVANSTVPSTIPLPEEGQSPPLPAVDPPIIQIPPLPVDSPLKRPPPVNRPALFQNSTPKNVQTPPPPENPLVGPPPLPIDHPVKVPPPPVGDPLDVSQHALFTYNPNLITVPIMNHPVAETSVPHYALPTQQHAQRPNLLMVPMAGQQPSSSHYPTETRNNCLPHSYRTENILPYNGSTFKRALELEGENNPMSMCKKMRTNDSTGTLHGDYSQPFEYKENFLPDEFEENNRKNIGSNNITVLQSAWSDEDDSLTSMDICSVSSTCVSPVSSPLKLPALSKSPSADSLVGPAFSSPSSTKQISLITSSVSSEVILQAQKPVSPSITNPLPSSDTTADTLPVSSNVSSTDVSPVQDNISPVVPITKVSSLPTVAAVSVSTAKPLSFIIPESPVVPSVAASTIVSSLQTTSALSDVSSTKISPDKGTITSVYDITKEPSVSTTEQSSVSSIVPSSITSHVPEANKLPAVSDVPSTKIPPVKEIKSSVVPIIVPSNVSKTESLFLELPKPSFPSSITLLESKTNELPIVLDETFPEIPPAKEMKPSVVPTIVLSPVSKSEPLSVILSESSVVPSASPSSIQPPVSKDNELPAVSHVPSTIIPPVEEIKSSLAPTKVSSTEPLSDILPESSVVSSEFLSTISSTVDKADELLAVSNVPSSKFSLVEEIKSSVVSTSKAEPLPVISPSTLSPDVPSTILISHSTLPITPSPSLTKLPSVQQTVSSVATPTYSPSVYTSATLAGESSVSLCEIPVSMIVSSEFESIVISSESDTSNISNNSEESQADVCEAKYTINDLPMQVRFYVMREGINSKSRIKEFSGAQVSLKGWYIDPEVKASATNKEQPEPVHVLLQGPRQCVISGIQMIEILIREALEENIKKEARKAKYQPPLEQLQESVLLEISNTSRSSSITEKVLKVLKTMLNFQIKTISTSLVKVKISQIAQLANFYICTSESSSGTFNERAGVRNVITLLETVLKSYSSTYLIQFSPVLDLLKLALDLPDSLSRVDLTQTIAPSNSDEPVKKKIKIDDKISNKTGTLPVILKHDKEEKKTNDGPAKKESQRKNPLVTDPTIQRENKSIPQSKTDQDKGSQCDPLPSHQRENEKNECQVNSDTQIVVAPSKTELPLEVFSSKSDKVIHIENESTKSNHVSSCHSGTTPQTETLTCVSKTSNKDKNIDAKQLKIASILQIIINALQNYSVETSNEQIMSQKIELLQYIEFFSKDILVKELTVLQKLINILDIFVPGFILNKNKTFSGKLMKNIILMKKLLLKYPSRSHNSTESTAVSNQSHSTKNSPKHCTDEDGKQNIETSKKSHTPKNIQIIPPETGSLNNEPRDSAISLNPKIKPDLKQKYSLFLEKLTRSSIEQQSNDKSKNEQKMTDENQSSLSSLSSNQNATEVRSCQYSIKDAKKQNVKIDTQSEVQENKNKNKIEVDNSNTPLIARGHEHTKNSNQVSTRPICMDNVHQDDKEQKSVIENRNAPLIYKHTLDSSDSSLSADTHQSKALAANDEPPRKKIKVEDRTLKVVETVLVLPTHDKEKMNANEIILKSKTISFLAIKGVLNTFKAFPLQIIGDSLARRLGFFLHQALSPSGTLNAPSDFAVSGLTIQGLAGLIERNGITLNCFWPTVLLIGTNDVLQGASQFHLMQRYKFLLRLLHRKFPGISPLILVQIPVFPRTQGSRVGNIIEKFNKILLSYQSPSIFVLKISFTELQYCCSYYNRVCRHEGINIDNVVVDRFIPPIGGHSNNKITSNAVLSASGSLRNIVMENNQQNKAAAKLSIPKKKKKKKKKKNSNHLENIKQNKAGGKKQSTSPSIAEDSEYVRKFADMLKTMNSVDIVPQKTKRQKTNIEQSKGPFVSYDDSVHEMSSNQITTKKSCSMNVSQERKKHNKAADDSRNTALISGKLERDVTSNETLINTGGLENRYEEKKNSGKVLVETNMETPLKSRKPEHKISSDEIITKRSTLTNILPENNKQNKAAVEEHSTNTVSNNFEHVRSAKKVLTAKSCLDNEFQKNDKQKMVGIKNNNISLIPRSSKYNSDSNENKNIRQSSSTNIFQENKTPKATVKQNNIVLPLINPDHEDTLKQLSTRKSNLEYQSHENKDQIKTVTEQINTPSKSGHSTQDRNSNEMLTAKCVLSDVCQGKNDESTIIVKHCDSLLLHGDTELKGTSKHKSTRRSSLENVSQEKNNKKKAAVVHSSTQLISETPEHKPTSNHKSTSKSALEEQTEEIETPNKAAVENNKKTLLVHGNPGHKNSNEITGRQIRSTNLSQENKKQYEVVGEYSSIPSISVNPTHEKNSDMILTKRNSLLTQESNKQPIETVVNQNSTLRSLKPDSKMSLNQRPNTSCNQNFTLNEEKEKQVSNKVFSGNSLLQTRQKITKENKFTAKSSKASTCQQKVVATENVLKQKADDSLSNHQSKNSPNLKLTTKICTTELMQKSEKHNSVPVKNNTAVPSSATLDRNKRLNEKPYNKNTKDQLFLSNKRPMSAIENSKSSDSSKNENSLINKSSKLSDIHKASKMSDIQQLSVNQEGKEQKIVTVDINNSQTRPEITDHIRNLNNMMKYSQKDKKLVTISFNNNSDQVNAINATETVGSNHQSCSGSVSKTPQQDKEMDSVDDSFQTAHSSISGNTTTKLSTDSSVQQSKLQNTADSATEPQLTHVTKLLMESMQSLASLSKSKDQGTSTLPTTELTQLIDQMKQVTELLQSQQNKESSKVPSPNKPNEDNCKVLTPSMPNEDSCEVVTPSMPNKDSCEVVTPSMPNEDSCEVVTPSMPNKDSCEVVTPSMPNEDSCEVVTPSMPNEDSCEVVTPRMPNEDSCEVVTPSMPNKDSCEVVTPSMPNEDSCEVVTPSMSNEDSCEVVTPSMPNEDSCEVVTPSMSNEDSCEVVTPSMSNKDSCQVVTPSMPNKGSCEVVTPSMPNEDSCEVLTPSKEMKDDCEVITPECISIDLTDEDHPSQVGHIEVEVNDQELKKSTIIIGSKEKDIVLMDVDKSVYASLAYLLKGTIHTKAALSSAAEDLHRKAFNFIRQNKDMFISNINKIYNQVLPGHKLNPKNTFNCCCTYLADPNNFRFHEPIRAIATIYRTPVLTRYENGRKINLIEPLLTRRNPPQEIICRGNFNYVPVVQPDFLLIGTWNLINMKVLTSPEKLKMIDSCLNKHNVDVACLQSCVFSSTTSEMSTDNYTWWCSGVSKNNSGIAFLVRMKCSAFMSGFTPHFCNLASADLSFRNKRYRIIGVDLSDITNSKQLATVLPEVISQAPPTSQVVLLGEFNAKIGHSTLTKFEKLLIGSDLHHKNCNENGLFLKNLAIYYNLKIVTTFPNEEAMSYSSRERQIMETLLKDSGGSHILIDQKPGQLCKKYVWREEQICSHTILASTLSSIQMSVVQESEALENLKVATWHVGDCSNTNQRKTIDNTLTQQNVDFVCIQETKMGVQGQLSTDNFNWWCSGSKPSPYNIAFLLRKGCGATLTDFKSYSNSVVSAIVTVKQSRYAVVGCYLLHCSAPEYQKTTNNIISALSKAPLSARLLLLGDFNAFLSPNGQYFTTPRHQSSSPACSSKVVKNETFMNRLVHLHELFVCSNYQIPPEITPEAQTCHILLYKGDKLNIKGEAKNYFFPSSRQGFLVTYSIPKECFYVE